MFGNILASIILSAFGTITWAKDLLFLLLTLCCLMGASFFLAMPTMLQDGEEKLARITDTSRLAFTDARVTLMIPFMMTNGMTLAFFLGDFQTDVTCPVAGPAYTGFVIAAFFGINAISSSCWGFLVTSKWLLRRTVFVASTVLVVTFLLIKQVWTVPQNYYLREGSTTWQAARVPDWHSILAVFSMACIFACGDAFCEAGPAMTLQTYFASSDKVVAAIASIRRREQHFLLHPPCHKFTLLMSGFHAKPGMLPGHGQLQALAEFGLRSAVLHCHAPQRPPSSPRTQIYVVKLPCS